MGCSASTLITVSPDQELSDCLSQEDVRLVQESWEVLAEDMVRSGMIIFRKLLNTNHEVRDLFKKMYIKANDGNESLNEVQLEKHAIIVMQALGSAIESLEDSTILSNILFSMGQKHRDYNVQPYMFKFLWQAIAHGLSEVLGDELDKKTLSAWNKIYNYLISKMALGLVQSH